jgi:hypothetical protein
MYDGRFIHLTRYADKSLRLYTDISIRDFQQLACLLLDARTNYPIAADYPLTNIFSTLTKKEIYASDFELVTIEKNPGPRTVKQCTACIRKVQRAMHALQRGR